MNLKYAKLVRVMAKVDQSASVSASVSANYRMNGHIEHNDTSQYPHTHQHPNQYFYRWRDHNFEDANTS